jgi:hypothetical protein
MFTREGAFRTSREPVSYALGVILLHFAGTLLHGLAHSRLGIGLNAAQQIFVVSVITIAPLVAGYLLWKGKLRSGGVLLAASMAGASAFGIFYHFIAAGADNVNHQFPFGLANWTRLFNQSAVGIAALEVVGLFLGFILVRKSGGRTSKS